MVGTCDARGERSMANGVVGRESGYDVTLSSYRRSEVKFTTRKMIQFFHCDPAGIVFYPQYFTI